MWFAPHTYVWDFIERSFFWRRVDVAGASADLPVATVPALPILEPLNRLVFEGDEESDEGWVSNQTYGFRTTIQVPTQTVRHGANDWVVIWGDVLAAAAASGQQVRAVHGFQVRPTAQGPGQVLLEFSLETEVPLGGHLQLHAEGMQLTSCQAAEQCEPYQPLPVLNCTGNSTIFMRHSSAIPPGHWCFILEASFTEDTTPLFTLQSFTSETEVGDVAATALGFRATRAMPFAEIVHDVDYALTGRDDHPGQASQIVLSFQLREAPRAVGAIGITVVAPLGFNFQSSCVASIGSVILERAGTGFFLFEPGMELLSCRGARNVATLQATPGLVPGRTYAFLLRVDSQPQQTPVLNQWYLTVADEGSSVMGYRLWEFTHMAVGLRLITADQRSENEVTILFQVTKTVTNQGFLSVRAPTDFRIAQACAASVQQLAFGSGLAISPLDAFYRSAPRPGVLCRGQHPATNRFEARMEKGRACDTAWWLPCTVLKGIAHPG
ncbi:unnamed protein product [Effrenium voratum]|nr:unnamed protein product [Effrenium voratum]